ncbi:capsular polysaccharide export protein, LipB/KpsS family [Sphingobium sp. CR28]|uniref:capsular polysaccharide export protein, LipB/KpsS family n=1 Tax=Sphingobium sp. CR28 TaxID=3400272 RepID=UPI003FF0A5C7
MDKALLSGLAWRNPFTGEPIELVALIALLGHWRRLIEENRGIVAAFGFALWKRDTVEPLLWDGANGPTFAAPTPSLLASLPAGARVACWKARVTPEELAIIEDRFAVVEVEDGFIRSVGLGADCVPPLSVVIDDMGVHYDPTVPNRLEAIIQQGDFSQDQLARAADLRALIVRHGIGKYGVAGEQSATSSDEPQSEHPENRRIVLVIGQVEDDRSVRFGSPVVRSNLALLEAARKLEPDAYIIYRPHPDVTAGHRIGSIPKAWVEKLADEIDPTSPISNLLSRADALHTMTSLAGFEALMRGKEVVCHGQPFYYGWGLTQDLAGKPARRTARRTIDELAAAVLLIYPRYLDPVTNLPCTPEILVMRLMSGVTRQNDALVPMRRLQGLLRRAVARLGKSI